ncbi:hypothetical protein J3Q64DRAFT_1762083 [Phycomyces blakesleeanus]|uniref:Uncharacterized protein n=1 Tax=Phycomyces blakesleeanus TaxID=4837 RepID=A0ABR3AQB0_PHYBL
MQTSLYNLSFSIFIPSLYAPIFSFYIYLSSLIFTLSFVISFHFISFFFLIFLLSLVFIFCPI